MTIFVDASAIVAIVYGEPEADDFADAIEGHNDRLYCAVGAWEAAHALARLREVSLHEAAEAVSGFAYEAGLRVVSIGEPERDEAIRAAARYGKGSRHPARLNMGDCFAYACAKTNDARLLYKGDDFSKTDLA
ncbi:type II toxin-antitoxin system VapC family toxin [Sphingomonas melonis]